MAKKPGLLEQLRPKLLPGRKILRFKGRPPLGIDLHVMSQPVRDELLTGSGPVLPQSFSELGLAAASSLDSSLQCRDVIAHEDAIYTNGLVSVNRLVCVTSDKKVCNVVQLESFRNAAVPNRARKTAQTKVLKAPRTALPGPDGKTLGERLELAMAHRSGMLGRSYEAVDLLREANAAAGATLDAPVISQQMISEIIRRRTTRSSFTPYLAKACGVSVLWLVSGRGSMLEG